MADEQPPSSETPTAGAPEAPEKAPPAPKERTSSSPPPPRKSRSLRPPPRAGSVPKKAPPPPPKSGKSKAKRKPKRSASKAKLPRPKTKDDETTADKPEPTTHARPTTEPPVVPASPVPGASSVPPRPSSVPPRASSKPPAEEPPARASTAPPEDEPKAAATTSEPAPDQTLEAGEAPPVPPAPSSPAATSEEEEARQRKRQKAQELDPERLKDARMIAALYLSDDDLLPAFRRQRLGRRSRATLEHLVMARDLVSAVVDSLRVDDDDQWERMRDAHDLLFSRETMVPDPPTQIDDGWLSEAPAEPGAIPPDRPTNPQLNDAAAPGLATTPAGGVPAAGWAPAPASWGQAYAPGSLPADNHEEMTPPRGIHQPGAQQGFAAYAETGGYDVPPPTSHDAAPTALMPNITQTLEPEAFDALMAAHGYEAPPPPSERTAPHQAPTSPEPPPVRHRSSVPPRSREEDSATHQLSFNSRAHPLAMSLEEFAAYCAERDHEPDRSLAIARRYEMPDERVVRVVTRSFELRFARNPKLRRQWQRAYEHFTQVLRLPS